MKIPEGTLTANGSEIYIEETGKTIARCDIGGRDEQTDFNAEFLSKAKEMYQALKFIEELYSKSYVILPEDYKKIESLIKEIES